MKKKIALHLFEMLDLQKLGLNVENASMYWMFIHSADAIIKRVAESGLPFKPEEVIPTEIALFVGSDDIPSDAIRAFDFLDILEMLPDEINVDQKLDIVKGYNSFQISYMNPHSGITPYTTISHDPLEAAHSTLKWLAKCNHISDKFLIPSARKTQ